MSDQDVKPVSASTGTFAVLRPLPESRAEGGRVRPGPGKPLPDSEPPDLEVLAQKLNIASQNIGRDLRFQVNLESGRSVIQVLDRETGEIIRQIPPENAKTLVSDEGEVELRLYDVRV